MSGLGAPRSTWAHTSLTMTTSRGRVVPTSRFAATTRPCWRSAIRAATSNASRQSAGGSFMPWNQLAAGPPCTSTTCKKYWTVVRPENDVGEPFAGHLVHTAPCAGECARRHIHACRARGPFGLVMSMAPSSRSQFHCLDSGSQICALRAYTWSELHGADVGILLMLRAAAADPGRRAPGLSSGLLSAQEVEHDVVNDVVGRGRLDHRPNPPG